jgi:hypothetical protein
MHYNLNDRLAGAGLSPRSPKLLGSGTGIGSGPSSPREAWVAKPAQPKDIDIWVRKWVDYSSKYGVGYILSNGCTGVYFNDSTKMILAADRSEFHYIERRRSTTQEETRKFSLSTYPSELQKKVTLLKHFQTYLETEND